MCRTEIFLLEKNNIFCIIPAQKCIINNVAVKVGQQEFMRKTYYLTKLIVSLPCMGLIPAGLICVCKGIACADYLASFIFALVVIGYIWLIWNFASPAVNPAFIKSAQSPRMFIRVNAVVAMVFVLVVLALGACSWPLLYSTFVWLGNEVMDLRISPQREFWWLYFCFNFLFQFVYLLLWESIRKQRWIRRLTIPNVCW